MVRQQSQYGKIGAMAAALTLALGGFALTGCSGSGETTATTTSDEAAEAQATDAEAAEKEDEQKHWFISKQRQVSVNMVPDQEGDGRHEEKSGTVTTYTRDEHGNVTKSVERSVGDDTSYGHRDVVRYTRDEQGWPLSEKHTRTYYYVMSSWSYDEDGNLSNPMRAR